MSRSSIPNSSVFSFASGVIILALITFGILKWIGMPVGSFLDWVIGVGIFIWLMTVVVVPWNIHFEAKEVLLQAKISKDKQIAFDQSNLGYVRKLASWSLIGALTLHIVSAAMLYWLAYAQISVVGYYGSVAAILLTLLRPSVRAYEYISERLSSIRQEIQYPRDDVATIYQNLEEVKLKVEALTELLNGNEHTSWRSTTNQNAKVNRSQIQSLQVSLQQLTQDNQKEHERIAKETQHAVAQLSEDGKFIDNLVEIIRFIKKV
jgi:hypothetical protein